MRKKQSLLWMALLAVFALAAASCGGDDGTTETTAVPGTTAEPDMNMTPGAGVSLTMARADWSTGYFQPTSSSRSSKSWGTT